MRSCSKCGVVYGGAEMFCPDDGSRLEEVGGDDPEVCSAVRRTSIPPEKDPFVGKVIQKRYRIIERIGEGGMGVVYVAEHIEIEKRVALKVLRDDFSKRPEVVERFRQEARSASKIGHEHIVDVTDFGQLDDGGVYFAMELLKGRGLSELCRGTPVPLERMAPIVFQIARALQAAHDKGIVHRDLKPENIFLIERDGNPDFVKILDFGIAKISDRDSEGKRLTKTGMIFGTPEYMAPEQAAGKPLNHQVDIYALGCIMFELLTGRVPYDGDSFMAVLTQHLFEPAPLIEEANPLTDAPPSVRAVVQKAMAKDQAERYAQMDDLRADLERALSDENYAVGAVARETAAGAAARKRPEVDAKIQTLMDWAPPTGSSTGPTPRRKRSVAPWIAAVVVILGVAGAGFAYLSGAFAGGMSLSVGAEGVSPPRDTGAPGPSATPTSSAVDVAAAASSAAPGTPAEAPTAPAERPVAPATKDSEVAAELAAGGSAEKIDVRIVSNPEGAVVSVDGMGQVCSETPCTVALEGGKPVKISVKRGTRREEQTFTPSSQNRELAFEMQGKPSGGQKKPRPEEKPAPAAKEPASVDELKIPDLYKNR